MPATPPVLPGPFTRKQGLRAGLTDWTIRSGYRQVLTDVYIPVHVALTPLVLAQAALLVAPDGSVVARHTAAQIWGGVAPDSPDVHLVLPPGSRVRRDGLDGRACADIDAVVRSGVPVTTPEQTFVHLAWDLDLVSLVVLGDSLVRCGATSARGLKDAAAAFHGRAAVPARRAAAYIRPGVDSPMESRLRMLLVLAGLPEPVVGHALRDDGGRVIYRLDLSYPALRVAVEYDGRQHASDNVQWRWDISRREDLDREGWRLVVVVSQDIHRHAGRTLDRVVGVLGERGVVVRRRREVWRRYFRHDG